MTTSKHPKTDTPNDLDLKVDPGIGRSRGAIKSREPEEALDGENTFEGDIGNDTRKDGSIDPDQRGRTNK